MLAAYPTGTLYNYLCARELEVAAIHPIPTEVRGVLAAVYLNQLSFRPCPVIINTTLELLDIFFLILINPANVAAPDNSE